MSSKESLPIKPDNVNLKLLSRAKLFLEHALSHSSSSSSLDRMIAIHGIDNAIEYLLRIISRHLEFESKANKKLPDNLSEIAGTLNGFLQKNYNYRLNYLDEIKLLRKVRNLVQHGASDPAPDMDRFVTVAKRFFDKSLKNIFGLNPDELRISQLITDGEVQKHLEKAEMLLEEEKYLESIVASRDAFENALFKKKQENRFRIDPAPLLADIKENETSFSKHFFRNISKLVEINSLEINFSKYERYREIIGHIPEKYRANWSGNMVMQRPWSVDDANFIYGLVSQNIYKWQTEELEPLYEIDPMDFEIIESIGGVEIDAIAPGMLYYSSDEEIQIYYVDTKTKDKLTELEAGKTYKYESLHYKKGNLTRKITYDIELQNLLSNLETNNPPRWELIIKFDKVPFTWHSRRYKDEELTQETPSLNNSNKEKLKQISGIGEVTAKRIISYRNAIGKIKNEEDLKGIKGITANKIDELKKITRL